MRYGVCLPTFRYGAEPTVEHVRAVALRAEELGYDSVWVGDHVLVPEPAKRMHFFADPFVVLAYVAGITSRVQLGTSVVIATLRNAAVLAKQGATLDHLSRGRFVLGLGGGWLREEFGFVGEPHDRLGARFDEKIAVLRTLWRECPATFSGEFTSFADAVMEPRPHSADGPPIWIGGSSEAAYRRAGRLGDAYHSDDTPAWEIERIKTRVDAHAAEAERSVDVTTRATVTIGPDDAAADADRGPGYYKAGDAWPGIVGQGDALRRQVDEFRAAGSAHFIAQFAHATVDEHLDAMERFAADVLA